MKLIKIFNFLLIILAASACSHTTKYKIGVSQNSYDDWRKELNEEINREMIFHEDAEVSIISANDDNAKQIADIRRFIEEDYDIIVVSPREAEALTPVIKEAYEKGIPVVLFDRTINGETYTAYQGADNYLIGKEAGLYFGNRMKDGGKIIEILGLAGSTPAVDRDRGFRDALKDFSKVELVGTGYTDWTPVRGAEVADSLLSFYPDVKAIFAQNDRIALAARKVAEKNGLNNIVIAGVDATPDVGIKAVADGVIDATFLYPTGGAELIRTAMKILKGEDYERDMILSTPALIDKTNARVLLLQNEKLKEETERIKRLHGKIDEFLVKDKEQTYLLYTVALVVLLLAGVVFLLLRAFWIRKQHQKELSLRNDELTRQHDELVKLNGDLDKEKNRVVDANLQLQEATNAKLIFFTNVSHDLRTPLTLIAEPVEQLSKAGNLSPEQKVMAKLANKNCRILMRLINQILDFRKYENGKLHLNLAQTDMKLCLKEWTESFRALAYSKHVHYKVDIDESADLSMAVDVERMERVLFNLVSNAFKYTPENGTICVSASRKDNKLVLKVSDTGKGMTEYDMQHIFERFYQIDEVHAKGSGIGLSLVKAFVELHKGKITVESEPGKGTVFTVEIPIERVDEAADDVSVQIASDDINAELSEVESVESEPEDGKERVLVIDDNADIRILVKMILGDNYAVMEASDGMQGIKMASKYIPDLIICDVMMPIMDGLECCRRLKTELNTSHIPVLLLTACSLDEQKVRGYESGADAYISKPFNADVLRARCAALLINRKRVKDVYSGIGGNISGNKDADKAPKMPSKADVKPISEIDSDFYNKFVDIVESEIGNSELSVEELGSRLGMGRVQFYRKIKALTSYSPVELIRVIRLKRAAKLLSTTERTVSEIAYEVGFATPSYFTKCFKDFFGESPSDLQKRTSRI